GEVSRWRTTRARRRRWTRSSRRRRRRGRRSPGPERRPSGEATRACSSIRTATRGRSRTTRTGRSAKTGRSALRRDQFPEGPAEPAGAVAQARFFLLTRLGRVIRDPLLEHPSRLVVPRQLLGRHLRKLPLRHPLAWGKQTFPPRAPFPPARHDFARRGSAGTSPAPPP